MAFTFLADVKRLHNGYRLTDTPRRKPTWALEWAMVGSEEHSDGQQSDGWEEKKSVCGGFKKKLSIFFLKYVFYKIDNGQKRKENYDM